MHFVHNAQNPFDLINVYVYIEYCYILKTVDKDTDGIHVAEK